MELDLSVMVVLVSGFYARHRTHTHTHPADGSSSKRKTVSQIRASGLESRSAYWPLLPKTHSRIDYLVPRVRDDV